MKQQVSTFINHCRVERGLSPNTLRTYEIQVGGFADYFSDISVEQVTHGDLSHYVAMKTKNGCSAKTAEMVIQIIRQFLDFFGNSEGHKVEMPKKPVTLPKPMSRAEVTKILHAVTSAKEAAILEILYGSGLRASELVNLKWSDIRGNTIRVRGKGNKEREVPIGRIALEKVHHYGSLRPPTDDPRLFPGLSRYKLYTICMEAGRRAGVAESHPHRFRHSFATHLMEGDCPLNAIQAMLGHESLETTAKYLKLDMTSKRNTIKKYHPRG